MRQKKSIFCVINALITACIALYGVNATADAPPIDAIEQNQMQASFNDLIAVMEETTKIATKTKMNVDFVPGMVTILTGDALEAKGATNVLEALTWIPGMERINVNLTVRGVVKWASGKVKILLNNQAINFSVSANPTPPFMLPIEAVERIEVIRGPGSAVYGEYAYIGVINIITRKKGSRIYGRFGSFDTFEGGGHYTYNNPENDLSINLNVAGLETDGDYIKTGEDILYSATYNQPGISYAPGRLVDSRRQRSTIFSLNYKDLAIEANYLGTAGSDHAGTTNVLPPPQQRFSWREDQGGIELIKQLDISKHLQGNLKLGWSQYAIESNKLTFFPPGNALVPYGFVSLDPASGLPVFHPNGVIGSFYAKEQRLHASFDAVWNKWENHTISTGLDLVAMQLTDVWSSSNFDTFTLAPQPWQALDKDQHWIKEGVKRKNVGFMLQDQISINDQIDITPGLRFDYYNDVGNALTPRIGAVYRHTDQHIFKAQYARAFRPPTMMEMYTRNIFLSGNSNIKPETIDTFELGYIFRSDDVVRRLTLFQSELNDLIDGSNVTGRFQNSSGASIKGIELELEQSLTRTLKLDSNLSYATSKEDATGEAIAGSTSWLGNAALLWHVIPDYLLVMHYRYIGTRYRATTDSRHKLNSTNLFNLTSSVSNLWGKDLTLRLSVQNLMDTDVIWSAPANTYPDDFPSQGRAWWLKLAFKL